MLHFSFCATFSEATHLSAFSTAERSDLKRGQLRSQLMNPQVKSDGNSAETIIETSSIGEGNSTTSNFVVTSALRCQYVSSRRLGRGLSLLEVLGLQSRWLGRQFSIRHPGSRKRATKTWRLLNLYTISSLQKAVHPRMNNLI